MASAHTCLIVTRLTSMHGRCAALETALQVRQPSACMPREVVLGILYREVRSTTRVRDSYSECTRIASTCYPFWSWQNSATGTRVHDRPCLRLARTVPVANLSYGRCLSNPKQCVQVCVCVYLCLFVFLCVCVFVSLCALVCVCV